MDLDSVLLELLPGSALPAGAVLGCDALLSALVAHGVDSSKMDTEEVIAAIDPSGKRSVAVTEMAANAKAFKMRHASVLEHLAQRAETPDATGFLRVVKLQGEGLRGT